MTHILVVDDENSIRITLRELLRDAGYTVKIAEDADQALELLAQESFDVLLSDIILPRVTGIKMLESVKDIAPDVEVVLMTGEPTVETASAAVRSGVADYLTKPISKEKLLKTIANVVLIKSLNDEGRRMTEENRQHRVDLELLVEERTRALQTSEEHFRSVVETARDAIITVNSAGRIVSCNAAAGLMFGHHTAEIIGQSLTMIIPEIFREEHQLSFRRVSSGGTPKTAGSTIERIGLRKDGSQFPFELSLTCWHSEQDTFFTAIVRNITKRKRVEEEREKALQEAQKANEVKNQFIANISHEIRTPLNSILGFSDLLRQRYESIIEEKDREIFGFITSSSNRLMRTVDSILNISQFEAGVLHIHPQKLDLVSITNSILEEFKHSALEKNLDIQLFSKYPELFVFVDEYCINQAIINLTDNAIKYTLKGGVSMNLDREGGHAILSITDTGIGISEEYQARIYEPYTQESEGLTRSFQGIGIGLALTKCYLELNDVKLQLESEKGIGTTFTLTFPTCEETSNV